MMTTLAIILLKLYRILISPILVANFGHACRYSPTCSEYAISTIEKHGLIEGGKLALQRFLTCNPYQNYEHL